MGDKFGDAKQHQAIEEMYGRLRRVIEMFCRTEGKNTVLRAMQNFVPHLKRTDRDIGDLPFYSETSTSRKTNREHCLLCVVSFAVQKFWDFREPTIESSPEDELELVKLVTFLEKIAKRGLAQYRVHGAYPVFRLVFVDDLERIQEEEVKADEALAERLAQENLDVAKAAEEADAKGGTEINTDDVANEIEDQEKAEAKEKPVDLDADLAARKADEAEAKAQTEDAKLIETGDKCKGDCDDCTDRVCDKQLGSPEDQAEENAAHKAAQAEEIKNSDTGDLGNLAKATEGLAHEEIVDESGEDTGDEGEGTFVDHDHAQDATQAAAAGEHQCGDSCEGCEFCETNCDDENDSDNLADQEETDEVEMTEEQQEQDAIEEQIDKKQIEDAEKKDAEENKAPPMPE